MSSINKYSFAGSSRLTARSGLTADVLWVVSSTFSKVSLIVFALITACSPQKRNTNGSTDHNMQGMVMISDRDRLLANIKTEEAVVKTIFETTTLVGKAAIDERHVEVLASRVKGRLDELFVKSPGAFVSKGQLVYSIYSEALLADENDYLLALKEHNKSNVSKDITDALLAGAKQKLIRWTLTEEQIKELEHSQKISPLIKFFSPYSGFILDLPVREGEYVDAGAPIFKLADLNTLWIETQVYSEEVKYLKQNQQVQIEFEAYPNETFSGSIVFENPKIEEDRKINLVRIQVKNVKQKIKPGMMAYIYLRHNEKKALVIPKSALLVESMLSVWVEVDGMFESRIVTTGIENKNEVEILSGLQPGDRVVVSGAFFLKSESIIQQGGSDMGGMKM